MGDLYLGLDLSTQSLKSVLIDDQLNLVHSDVVVLDELGWDFLFRSILVSDSIHLWYVVQFLLTCQYINVTG